MRILSHRLTGRLSVLLAIAMLLSIITPAYTESAKDKSGQIVISSFTDRSGSTNISAGRAEGIAVGAKGTIQRDGKQIGEYVVEQVNWGYSKIAISNLLPGYTVQVGDTAPLNVVPSTKSSSGSKSKILRTVLIIAGVAAAVALLSGHGGGGSSSGGSIDLTAEKTSTDDSEDGTTTSTTITAKVYKATGEAADDGTTVTFSTTAGTLSRTQGSTSAGKITATLTTDKNDSADSATVKVKALGKTASIVISLKSSIELTASPTEIQLRNSGGSNTSSTITAVCKDKDGNPVTSGTVKFSASMGTVESSVDIDSNGTATTAYSSDTSGKASITATWSDNTATTYVTVKAGAPYSITMSSSSSSLQCDGNSSVTISATVKDAGGNTVTNGTLVDFSVAPDNSGGGNGTIVSQVATSNGVARATLTSKDSTGTKSKAGTATITAKVLKASQPSSVPAPETDLINDDLQVQFIAIDAAVIRLGASTTNIRGWDTVGNTTTITAVVYTASNNPVPDGTAVFFSTTHGMINGSDGTSNKSTTTNGKATATLTTDASGSGSWDGLVDITATCGNISQTGSGLVIFSGPPSPSHCEASISQSTLSSVGGQATITVTAKDINGNAVADGTKVTATTDKGTFSSSSSTTSNGTVVFTLTTSTDNNSPTQTGTGTATISIDSGGKNSETSGQDVKLTVTFTVS